MLKSFSHYIATCKMPRGTKKKPNYKNNNVTKSTSEIEVTKIDKDETNTNVPVVDLSNFKFEQRPHIKIEYDNDSPPKQDNKGIWEPPHWRDFLLNLKIMRSNCDAPVDTMGCHMSMDENAPPEVYRYQCLISLMLSSQTKDQVTFAAMERLRAKGLTIDNVLQMSDEELGQLIYPVGFWKTKVKYIKKTTQILKDIYNGDIPDSVDKLCKLTGVGPKMAHICMKVAWNKITGIGVDTHVHRISNRIGWVKKTTNTPEDTRKALQTWIPFDLWSEVNHLMVGFGQTICLPINPNCHECLNSDICPSSNRRKSPKNESEIKIEKSLSPTLKIKSDHYSNLHIENEHFETNQELLSESVIISRKCSPKQALQNRLKVKKEANSQQDEEYKQPFTQLKVTRSKSKYELKASENSTVKQSPLTRKSLKNKQSAVSIHSLEENNDIVKKKKSKRGN